MTARIKKRTRVISGRQLISVTDVLILPELSLLAMFAILIPERYWRTYCYWYEWLKWRIGVYSLEGILRGRSGLSRVSHSDALRIAATRTEHHTQIMRELTLGWNTGITLIGREHIEAALALGRGAVLWIAHFSFNSLASKKAFNAAGFQVHHVSRPEHGFSKTLFGIRLLNPIRVRAEAPYMAGRIIIKRDKPAESMQRAMQLLRQNELVSITAGAWEGQTFVAVDMFGSELEMTAGAPRLAYAAGSVLLPVYTVRPGGPREIQVVVGSPLQPHGSSRDEFVRFAAETFARETALRAAEYPEQWRDWEKLKCASGHPSAKR